MVKILDFGPPSEANTPLSIALLRTNQDREQDFGPHSRVVREDNGPITFFQNYSGTFLHFKLLQCYCVILVV